MTAGELCNRSVVFCERTETLVEVARRMRDHNVGCLVVVEPGDAKRAPVGIVTDRDLVVAALASGVPEPRRIRVEAVMSAPVHVAREAEDLTEVLRRMRAAGVRRLPVVDEGGGLQGLLAMDDVVELLTTELGELVALVSRQRVVEPA